MSTLSLPVTVDVTLASDAAPLAARRWSKRTPRSWQRDQAIVATAATAAPVLAGAHQPLGWAALAFVAFAAAAVAVRRAGRWAAMLPLTSTVLAVAQPLVGGATLLAGAALAGLPGSASRIALAGAAAAAAATLLVRFQAARRAPVAAERIAVIGSAGVARQLRQELEGAGRPGYLLVGSIEIEDDPRDSDGHAERLGLIGALEALVAEHAIDLLLVAPGASRPEVFERVADCLLDRPVDVCELSEFYESTFGHVPAAEIDGAWFRYLMHPSFRSPDTAAKRALDLTVSLAAALVFMPVLLVCAALIKLHDGGPVFFCQRRIGAGGRPFTLFKLRSMRVEPLSAAWSSANDPRVTPIGRLMRKTHIDELPQLLNIVRGEMSIVGPRPEQPEFVERLGHGLGYYARRHMIKPGLTGWAQVRCGYAGSDAGSALKLCHDLFYLKHRSFGLDLAILLETVGKLVADTQYPTPVAAGAAPSAASEDGEAALRVAEKRGFRRIRVDLRPAANRNQQRSDERLAGVERA